MSQTRRYVWVPFAIAGTISFIGLVFTDRVEMPRRLWLALASFLFVSFVLTMVFDRARRSRR